MTNWFSPPVPTSRIVWLRRAIYLVVLLDVFVFTTFPIGHATVPADLYRPLPIRSILHVPMPSPTYVQSLRVVIVAAAVLCIANRIPRIAGWVCALGMLDWVSNAYSYSKINHDHFALMVALFVLPLAASRARSTARIVREQGNGFVVRCIQMAVVATYFLAGVSKVLDAGWGWASSAVLIWAITRRGSMLGDLVGEVPALTYFFQWVVFIAELCAPVMLWLRGRYLYAAVAFWVVFHISTFLLLGIHFVPTAVCLLAFVCVPRRRGREGSITAVAHKDRVID